MFHLLENLFMVVWELLEKNVNWQWRSRLKIRLNNEGLGILSSGSGDTACGGEVRPKSGRKKSTTRHSPMKQEAHAYS